MITNAFWLKIYLTNLSLRNLIELKIKIYNFSSEHKAWAPDKINDI